MIIIALIPTKVLGQVWSGNSITSTTGTYLERYYDRILGIKLQYPSNWMNVTNERGGYVTLYPGKGVYSGAHIPEVRIRTILSNGPPDLRNLTVNAMFQLHNSPNMWNTPSVGDRNMEFGLVSFASQPALKLLFTGPGGLKGMIVTVSNGSRSFYLSYIAYSDSFNKYSLTANDILDSFVNSSIVSPAKGGIEVGSNPVGVSFDPITNKIYVVNSGSNTVTIIDGYTDNRVGNVTVGSSPAGEAISPLHNFFVVNSGSNTVSIIDGKTNTMRTIPSEIQKPTCVEPVSPYAYVCNDNSVAVIFPNGTGKVVSKDMGPYVLAADELDNVYIAAKKAKTISIINTHDDPLKVAKSIILDSSPIGMSADPTNDLVYVLKSRSIAIIDSSNFSLQTSQIPVGDHATKIKVDPQNNMAYVTNNNSNSINLVDLSLNRMKNDTIKVGIATNLLSIFRQDLAINPNAGLVYVTDMDSGRLFIVNASTNRPLVGMRLVVAPENSGSIACKSDNQIWSTTSSYYVLVPLNKELTCQAFSRTQENPSVIPEEIRNVFSGGIKFKDWSGSLAFGTSDNPTRFETSQYGTLAATFEDFPPSTDLLIGILGILLTVATIGAGWLIKRNQQKRARTYMATIERIYETTYKNPKECLEHLDEIRNHITSRYARGELNDSEFSALKDKISGYIESMSVDNT